MKRDARYGDSVVQRHRGIGIWGYRDVGRLACYSSGLFPACFRSLQGKSFRFRGVFPNRFAFGGLWSSVWTGQATPTKTVGRVR